MNNVVLISITEEKLTQIVEGAVHSALKGLKDAESQDALLTTKQVAKLFGVSNVTISSWIKKGTLKKYTQGGRSYFKHAEIMEGLKTIKKYKQ